MPLWIRIIQAAIIWINFLRGSNENWSVLCPDSTVTVLWVHPLFISLSAGFPEILHGWNGLSDLQWVMGISVYDGYSSWWTLLSSAIWVFSGNPKCLRYHLVGSINSGYLVCAATGTKSHHSQNNNPTQAAYKHHLVKLWSVSCLNKVFAHTEKSPPWMSLI